LVGDLVNSQELPGTNLTGDDHLANVTCNFFRQSLTVPVRNQGWAFRLDSHAAPFRIFSGTLTDIILLFRRSDQDYFRLMMLEKWALSAHLPPRGGNGHYTAPPSASVDVTPSVSANTSASLLSEWLYASHDPIDIQHNETVVRDVSVFPFG
jgi:hypothetical protein